MMTSFLPACCGATLRGTCGRPSFDTTIPYNTVSPIASEETRTAQIGGPRYLLSSSCKPTTTRAGVAAGPGRNIHNGAGLSAHLETPRLVRAGHGVKVRNSKALGLARYIGSS